MKERKEIWDPKAHKHVPEKDAPSKKSKEPEWARYYYTDMMNLAYTSRIPLIAVLAELHHLRFKSSDKEAPVALSNKAFKELGFSHHDKDRALQHLEEAGMAKVQRRAGKSPSVTLTRKHHGL
jgi:hypothetical protein